MIGAEISAGQNYNYMYDTYVLVYDPPIIIDIDPQAPPAHRLIYDPFSTENTL